MSHSATAPAPVQSGAGTHGVSFGGVLRSEFIKFWSLLSTKLLLVISLVAIVGIGAFVAFGVGYATDMMRNDPLPPGTTAGADHSSGLSVQLIPTSGVQLGMLILGALAVMFIASEYSTGMIRSSFAATPSRLPVFWAKSIVIVLASYVLTVVGAFASFLVAIPILNAYNVDIKLDQEGMLSSILLSGLFVAGVALMGLALGTLFRNSAAGIVILVGLMFVVPIAATFLMLLNIDFFTYLPQYFPSNAGSRMLETGHTDGVLDPLAAGFVFLGWILVMVIPALFVLKRRDA